MASDSESSITLAGLVSARWVIVGLLSVGALAMALVPGPMTDVLGTRPTRLSVLGFAAVLVTWAAINAATARLVATEARPSLAGAHLLVDAVALTVLLALTGGASNPFTMLYFVPITLATQVSPRWTWSLAAVSLVGFAGLFVLVPLPHGPTHHAHHFAGHLRGMWVAFGLSGLLITIFVHAIARRLAEQRHELARLREAALQDRHLAAIGSLAGGAAHELGTPLNTIALLVAELPHMNPDERADASTSIKDELARCKTIVQRMATPDLRVSELGQRKPWPLASLASWDPADLRGITVRHDVTPRAHAAHSTQPKQAIAQVLRELVFNAADAYRRQQPTREPTVELEIDAEPGRARLSVRDHGPGLDDAIVEAAFDPFVSTKPDGEGMGMGLYLARAQMRQIGGSIGLSSTRGQGTTVTIEFPLTPGDAAMPPS